MDTEKKANTRLFGDDMALFMNFPVDNGSNCSHCLGKHDFWDCPELNTPPSSPENICRSQPSSNFGTRMHVNHVRNSSCELCKGAHGYSHCEDNCPSWMLHRRYFQQRYGCDSPPPEPPWRHNYWSSPNSGNSEGQSASPSNQSSSDSQDSPRENKPTFENKMLEKMESLTTLLLNMQEDSTQMKTDFEQRIQALEQGQTDRDTIIKEQTKLIKKLEEKLNDKTKKMVSFREQQEARYREHQEKIEKSEYMIDLFEEKCRQISGYLRSLETDDESEDMTETPINLERKLTQAEIESIASLAEIIRKQVSLVEEKETQNQTEVGGCLPTVGENITALNCEAKDEDKAGRAKLAEACTLDTDPWEAVATLNDNSERETIRVTIGKCSAEPILKETRLPQDTDDSCTVDKNIIGCLNIKCENQLKACVNLLKETPLIAQVKADEIKAMSRKKKRRVKQRWVPLGTFNIKEELKVAMKDEGSSEALMPYWEKHMQRIFRRYDIHE